MDDGQKADGAKIAVFDVGKTNIKLSVMTFDSVLAESLFVRNVGAHGEKRLRPVEFCPETPN
ncbi:hypothetical protein [Mesorhizobium sp. M0435]|uniref:hypothetical protein n=1 Tax=Mesorhizobium sp. M0435 TaxID=2956944 RepID=UPI00333BFDFA